MTETTKPPSKAKTAADVNTLQQLHNLLDKLTPEQKLRYEQQLGMKIPEGDLTAALEGRYKFGVRCVHCNQIALMFVGDKWKLEGGDEVDVPPQHLHHTRISWTQNLPPEEINRHTPQCQNCGEPVALQPDGSFRSDRQRIVNIEAFVGSRDEKFNRKFLREFQKKVNEDASKAEPTDVSTSYDLPNTPISQVIAEQQGPQALNDIEYVAQRSGVAELVATGKIPG